MTRDNDTSYMMFIDGDDSLTLIPLKYKQLNLGGKGGNKSRVVVVVVVMMIWQSYGSIG